MVYIIIVCHHYTDTCIKHIIGAVNGRHKRGRIFSPNYPLEYPSNTECVWKITVPDNAALKLNFDDFSTECSYDYLEIHHLTTAEGGIERYVSMSALGTIYAITTVFRGILIELLL